MLIWMRKLLMLETTDQETYQFPLTLGSNRYSFEREIVGITFLSKTRNLVIKVHMEHLR